MKTLYISDLDGTLLNDNAVISEYSRAELKRLTDEGVFFTVATARTTDTATMLIEGTGINMPVVLMNGVCIYDIQRGRYIKIERISDEAKRTAQRILDEHGVFGFWYAVKDNAMTKYYVKPGSPAAERVIMERAKMGKPFTKIERFSDCLPEPLIYYSICNIKEKIEAAAVELKKVEGLRIEFYKDTYLENHWYLELCADTVSKREAVQFLRGEYGFDKVVGFGDNLNDLPMFEACDVSCAMANAVAEVKSKATHVIGSNNDDVVVRWILDVRR